MANQADGLAAIREAIRGCRPVRVELPGRRKDGTQVWAEWQVVPVAGAGDRHTHSVAILWDTTERRRAEQALRESEVRFRNLFEQAADAIFVLEREGRIVDANRRACQSLGYAREELNSIERNCSTTCSWRPTGRPRSSANSSSSVAASRPAPRYWI